MTIPTTRNEVLDDIERAIKTANDIHIPKDKAGVVRATILGHLNAAKIMALNADFREG